MKQLLKFEALVLNCHHLYPDFFHTILPPNLNTVSQEVKIGFKDFFWMWICFKKRLIIKINKLLNINNLVFCQLRHDYTRHGTSSFKKVSLSKPIYKFHQVQREWERNDFSSLVANAIDLTNTNQNVKMYVKSNYQYQNLKEKNSCS